jgi:hypothetical protein
VRTKNATHGQNRLKSADFEKRNNTLQYRAEPPARQSAGASGTTIQLRNRNHPGLSYQQDGGAGHTAVATLALLKSWGVVPISWPPFSPDLSPIEDIWNRLKGILQEIDPAVHRNSRGLREAVLRAWNAITDAEVRERIRTMHQRCLDVIAGNGMEKNW